MTASTLLQHATLGKPDHFGTYATPLQVRSADLIRPRSLFNPAPAGALVLDGSTRVQLKTSGSNLVGFPNMTVTNEGVTIAVWMQGVGVSEAIATGANRGVLKVARSLAWGASGWTTDSTLVDSNNFVGSLTPYIGWDVRESTLTTLADGRVLLAVNIAFDANTRRSILAISTDGGATFPYATMREIPTSLYYTLVGGPVRELPDGSWLVAAYGLPTSGATNKNSVVLRSTDEGATWTQVTIGDSVADGRTYNEPVAGIVTNASGVQSLMCLIRSDTDSRIYKTTTTDLTGLTGWTAPSSQFDGRARPSWVQSHPGGPIVALTRDTASASPPDTSLFYTSRDFGVTWTSKSYLDPDRYLGNYASPVALAAGQLGVVWANKNVATHQYTIYWSLLVDGNGTPVTGIDRDIPKSLVTAKGSLLVATAAGTVVEHVVPATAGQTFIADSSQADGWIADYPLSRPDAYLRPTGAVAETFSRRGGQFVNTGAALISGQLAAVALILPANRTISSITFMSGGTAMAGQTHQWFGLADSSLNVLGKTSDDTTAAWAQNVTKTLNLTAPIVTTYAGLYYVCIVLVATTMPTMYGPVTDTNSAPNTIPPIVCGLSTTGLTDPASLGSAIGALTGTGRKPYAYVS